jgi:hypothetical protein
MIGNESLPSPNQPSNDMPKPWDTVTVKIGSVALDPWLAVLAMLIPALTHLYYSFTCRVLQKLRRRKTLQVMR